MVEKVADKKLEYSIQKEEMEIRIYWCKTRFEETHKLEAELSSLETIISSTWDVYKFSD